MTNQEMAHQNEQDASAKEGKSSEKQENSQEEKHSLKISPLVMITIAFVVGLSAIAIYGVQAKSVAAYFAVSTVGILVAGAFLLIGVLVGFLFGIPRSLQQPIPAGQDPNSQALQNFNQSNNPNLQSSQNSPERNAVSYQANTNLEQISDWLTKIIVGVGLTQLSNLPDALDELSARLAPGLGGFANSEVYSLAIVFYFSISGFLFGYLWTRLNLAGELREADIKGLTDKVREVTKKLKTDAVIREVEQVDVKTTEWDELRAKVKTLLEVQEVRSAIEVGRRYLKEERYDTSLQIFEFIRNNIDEDNEYFRKVLSNTGYSLIGLKRYEEALPDLLRIETLEGGKYFKVWHAIAIAYCYYSMNNNDQYSEWLEKTKKMPGFGRNVSFFQNLYPEIKEDLVY